mmetsp:Transcript_10241/g.11773  ORF Transcript_10241/g.11773 Transcript_10241/m.11773 type:complete len:824 (+) Transcript_10241:243-2714(+)
MDEYFVESDFAGRPIELEPLGKRWKRTFYQNNPKSTGNKYLDGVVNLGVNFISRHVTAWEQGYPIEIPKLMPEGPERERIWAEQRAKYDARQKLSWREYLKVSLKWTMVIYIGLVHVLSIVGLALLPKAKPLTILWFLILWPFTAFGITVGAHRLWSHRSYEAGFAFRFFVMILASLANQGSIWHWARDHRVHHKTSETAADPHNAKRGFFFAHVGWLLVEKDPRVSQFGATINMDDLADMWEVRFNKYMGFPWNAFWCFLAPGLVATSLWGENLVIGFFIVGVLRYVISLHVTWCVNSVAHLYGHHPYEDINPAESPWVSLGAMGEGWHNWHHAFPFDYATSELGPFRQFNPSKMFIDLGAHMGLVWGRRRATDLWEMRKQKLANGDKIVTKLKGLPMFEHRVVTYGKNRETRIYENQTFLKLKVNAEGIKDTEKLTSEVRPRSAKEVAKHNKEDDAWVVIHGKVYDVTKFKSTHPGGEEIVQLYAGEASNRATHAFEITGHSDQARALMKDMFVGDLERSESVKKASLSKRRKSRKSKSRFSASKKMSLVSEPDGLLSPLYPISFTVLDKTEITHNSILMTLQATNTEENESIGLPIGRHLKLDATIDGSVVERSYTPIPVEGLAANEIALCVKIYRAGENSKFPEGGKMTQHLESLEAGDHIGVKGPFGLISYKGKGIFSVAGEAKKYSKAAFVCGGSGITPAYSILATALADSTDKTEFHLLYANNKPSDIMLRDELDKLADQYGHRFKIHYTVSDASEDPSWAFSEGFINEEMIKEHVPSGEAGDCFVGVCGPPPMIKLAAVPNLKKHGYNSTNYCIF